MKIVRKLVRLVFALALIAALIIAGSMYWEIFHSTSKKAAEVTIPRGSSLVAVARSLQSAGVIRSPEIFALYARFKGVSGRLAAGDYEFAEGLSLADVLDKIVRGDVKRYTFTVIEGWNVSDIAKMLAAHEKFGPAVAQEFLEAVRDRQFMHSVGMDGLSSLEGYLFPDTYVVVHPKDVREIVTPMVRRFNQLYDDTLKLRARELGMTDDEVITLASIIEKETGRDDERALVSSVFQNRLKQHIPLASDPTVIYGIANFDGNLRRRDLETPGPYNTYLRAGLPPGPIANPGLASIKAALYPAQSPYLYFVSRNDGSHHFSETLAEHSKAVQHYQVRRSTSPLER